PPHQTEDPLSPPCVAYFDGDNGGATAQGVTGSEIVVVFYLDAASFADCSPPDQSPAQHTYYDLGKPPVPSEQMECYTRILRNWQRYFNDRYQTYKRTVHFWAYLSGTTATPETRRADAEDIYKKLHPFATIFMINTAGFPADYSGTMAAHHVMYFTGGLFAS